MAEWGIKREIENIIAPETLEMIDYMIIGGGLPSIYTNTNVKVFDSIFKKIKEMKDWLNINNIKMIVEPGRFIAAPSVKLLVEEELEKGNGQAYAIKGITPCSMDLFRYKVYLKNIKVGDKIIFLNAGAYNFSTDFCDLEKIETKIID